MSETNARSDVISDRLDEVHARHIARSTDRHATSNADEASADDSSEQ